jgi:type VI secretion system secreted protein VgrG
LAPRAREAPRGPRRIDTVAGDDEVREATAGASSGGSSLLAGVRYTFESTGEPSNQWRVTRVKLREALSEPYHCTLDLANEVLEANPDALLGFPCELTIRRGEHSRRLCGIVQRVEHRGAVPGHRLARVEIVPALQSLAQRFDSYIFQGDTVPQILATVLSLGLAPYEREVDITALQRDYPVREYCVQYRESDLDFVHRLMQEEGIAYYFNHDGDREVLTLVDSKESYPAQSFVPSGPVSVLGHESEGVTEESVRHFDLSRELRSTSFVVRDFDWTQPALDVTVPLRGQDVRSHDREVYEYPAPLTLGPYDEGQRIYSDHDGSAQAQLRREYQRGRDRLATGTSNVTGFMPGLVMELVAPGQPEADGSYLLTRVEHVGEAQDEVHGGHGAPGETRRVRYENVFECMLASLAFRPDRRTRKPRISGVQTATVVGPESEEIYTDPHGRIKVQFHWDRVGARNEHSSCWVRVAQTWAGPGWGTMFLPRIGMEVIVTFVDGDPDRPLVTGCVYNGQNATPYPLPADKTKSTIKSNSSPGGNGFNELRFEDAAGSEEIYVHAQKDYNEVVLHDHSTTVNRHQKNHVKGNQTENVDCNQTMTVGGVRTHHVKKEEHITVDKDQDMTVKGNRTKTVEKDEKETVKQNQIARVEGNRTETVVQNESLTVQGNETLSVTGTRTKTVTAAESNTLSSGRSTNVTMYDFTQVTGASVTNVTGGCITLVEGAHNVTAAISSTILVLPSVFSMLPQRIDMSAPSKVAIKSGTAKIELSPGKIVLDSGAGAKIELSGTDIKISGVNVAVEGSAKVDVTSPARVTVDGMLTTIKGSPVKVNC